ncbi:MAG: ATP synthase F1 subunit epsilon [Ruminiclostridium sp.]|nr:ATP synthase F1 subunit epsilon [Ruminiclostridium sp.]MBQ8842525.1 ATP synthase F1 subunit epsilon [Ruminiclostridium sp.]
MTPFKLQIITPDGVFYDGMTENVIVRTTVGDKGILARHEPYVAALPIGKFKVKIDGEFRYGAIASGTIKVDKDKTVILAQSCEWAEEIDLDRAVKAKELAEQRLEEFEKQNNDTGVAVAEYKLKRAINRIETYKLKK